MKINSVLIAGAGAIGLCVAETIYKYDPHSVSILVKGERLERYRKNGLWVNGEKLDFRFSCGEKADFIIIATKFHHLDEVIEDVRPSLTGDAVIFNKTAFLNSQ